MTEKLRLPEFERVPQRGSIEVISGCMFSGKSRELKKRLDRAPFGGDKVQAFTPSIDDRRGEATINTYDGETYPSIAVDSSLDILPLIESDTNIVAIDEAQFFDLNLPDVCRHLASSGKRVIVAGLDSNFRGEVFGPMGDLVVEADEVEKMQAYCVKCGGSATRTQRMKMVDGELVPADYDDPIIQVGEREYEPRCRHCHEVPGRPEISQKDSEE